MNWLEVIQIRAAQNRSEKLVEELTALISKLQEGGGGAGIALFRNAQFPFDFSLNLNHQSDTVRPGKTNIGRIITSAAKEYGLVDHTIWVLERPTSD